MSFRFGGSRSAPPARPSWPVYRRLLGFARPYARRLAAAAVLLVVSTALYLAWPQFVQRLVDGAVSSRDGAQLDRTVLLLIAVLVARMAVDSVRGYLVSWTGERIIADLRIRLAQHLLGLDVRAPDVDVPEDRGDQLKGVASVDALLADLFG